MFFELRSFSDFGHQTCCFCIHVRTGTVLIGMAHCFWYAIDICMKVLIMVKPQSDITARLINVYKWVIEMLETIHYKSKSHLTNNFYPNNTINSNPAHNSFFDMSTSLFFFFFCWLLVYGAISKRPTHILPYFCLAIFTFAINLLNLVGQLTNGMNSSHDSRREGLVTTVAIKTIILSLRGYAICVVWDCYKYLVLTSRNVSLRHIDARNDYVSPYDLIHDLFSSGGNMRNGFFSRYGRRRDSGPDHEGNTFPHNRPDPKITLDQVDELPKYEDALKIPANAYAPPPYFDDNSKYNGITQANSTNEDNTDKPNTSSEVDNKALDNPEGGVPQSSPNNANASSQSSSPTGNLPNLPNYKDIYPEDNKK